MNLVGSLRRRASLVLLVVVAALVYGALSLAALPSGIYPEVDFPRLVAVAHVGDLPPEVLQTEVAAPMEGALATVPGVRRLRTRVIRGAVEIAAQLDPGSDMTLALQRAEARLAEVHLPPGAELRLERVTPLSFPVVSFNLAGADPRTLRDLASYVVAPALTRVAGVGLVQVDGGDQREIEVVLDPDKLAAAHLSPGMHPRHYSPATRLLLVGNGAPPREGRGAYLWLRRPAQAARSIGMPPHAADYAAVLYDTLHQLDREGLDWIAVEMPPDTPDWAAIHDRLQRAASR